MSELHKDLQAALAAMSNPTPEGKSNRGAYVTLDQLTDHGRALLQAHRLAVTVGVWTEDGTVRASVTFLHPDGAYTPEPRGFGVPAKGPSGQEYHAALTFARRGALLSALNITGGNDDAVVPRGQVAELGAAFTRAGIRGREERLERVAFILGRHVESSKELSEVEAALVLRELDSYRGE